MVNVTQLEKAKFVAKILLLTDVVEIDGLSPIIVKHPFFECGVLYDNEGLFVFSEDRDRFERYLDSFYKDVIERCESIEQIVYRVAKAYRICFIKHLLKHNVLSRKECGNLLAEIWTVVENINHDVNVPKNQILSWIKQADKDVIMNEKDKKVYDSFADIVEIYRGTHEYKDCKGICWTIDKKKAVWFANRYNKEQKYLYIAKIKKEHIIAYTNGRGEHEVIIDYNFLNDVQEIVL